MHELNPVDKHGKYIASIVMPPSANLAERQAYCCNRPGPVFCLSLGVSSDYAQPIAGRVTEVTCLVIDQAQPELTPNKRQKTGPEYPLLPHFYPRTALAASVCVSLCVNQEFVRAITHRLFKLGSPNLDYRCERPWLRSLLFWGWLTLTFKDKFNLQVKIYPILSLSAR